MTVETLTEDLKTATGAARDLGAQALGAVKDEAASLAASAGEGLRAEAKGRIESGKEGLADRGQQLTHALQRRAGHAETELERRVLRALAAGVDQLSGDLQGRSVDSLFSDASRFARSHPAAFIAGAALAGFAAARFARASADAESATHREVPGYSVHPDRVAGAAGVPEGHAFAFATRASVNEASERNR